MNGGFQQPFGQVPARGGVCGNPPEGAEFPVSQGRAMLAANATGIHPAANTFVEAVAAEATRTWPRCITAHSNDGRPFDMEVTWTQGSMGRVGPIIVTSVAGSAKLHVNATAVTVRIAGWENVATTQVQVGISSDEPMLGINSGIRRIMAADAIAAGPGTAVNLGQVPRFAKSFQAISDVEAELGNIAVEFLDAAAVVRAQRAANLVPQPVPPTFGQVRLVNGNAVIVGRVYLSFDLEW